MNESHQNPTLAMRRFEAEPKGIYSIEAVALITQTPRRLIAIYCRDGLIAPVAPPERDGWRFDGDSVCALRRIEELREEFDLNLRTLRMIAGLWRENERLREECGSSRTADQGRRSTLERMSRPGLPATGSRPDSRTEAQLRSP
jgi:hypothetical protein